MWRVGPAVRAGRVFVELRRMGAGLYRLEWPVPDARTPRGMGVGWSLEELMVLVARLRHQARRQTGFLDPVEDALFLTVALRRLGIGASFHVGRELLPAVGPAGMMAWVQCGELVLSTSLPVREQYVELTGPESGAGVVVAGGGSPR